MVGGFSSKVGKSDGESNITQKQKSMEKKQARRTGKRTKTDPADYKYSFRLNAQEKSKFEKLFLESGARDRTIFIKKSIFSEQLKVIKVDKASIDYYIRLGEFYRQFQAIGNNYNQVVRAVQKNFGEKRAMSLLYKLEKATLELILLNKQIMALTKEYEKKWLQEISHGASLYGALAYNHEKVFQGTAEILSGHRMISDRPGLPSEDMRLALLSF